MSSPWRIELDSGDIRTPHSGFDPRLVTKCERCGATIRHMIVTPNGADSAPEWWHHDPTITSLESVQAREHGVDGVGWILTRGGGSGWRRHTQSYCDRARAEVSGQAGGHSAQDGGE